MRHDGFHWFQYSLGEQKDISIAELAELSSLMCVGLPSLSMQRPRELTVRCRVGAPGGMKGTKISAEFGITGDQVK